MLDEATRLKALAEFELRRRNKNFTEYLEMVSPNNQWNVPHLLTIRPYLERIANLEPLKVLVLAPPRHGKSEHNTRHFSSYFLYKNPTENVLLGGYNQEFANGLSLFARNLYRQSMPNESVKNSIMEWHTDRGGMLKAFGLQGGVTGRGGRLLNLDDPVKNRDQAYSKLIRDKVWNTYKVDLYTRLEPRGSIVLTMTHWHHDDLAGRLLNSKDGKNWIVLRFPALAEEDDILGRKKGEALWPERYSREDLLEIKEVVGDEFGALYQQRAIIVAGNLIKREWFIVESSKNWPIKFDFIGQYWDTAQKTGQNNDYSVCTTLAKHRNIKYLLNVFRAKLESPDLEDAVIEQACIYKPHFIGIEDKSSGSGTIQALKRRNDLPVIPEALQANTDKILRVNTITASLRNNPVHIDENAHWKEDFLDEICLFPQAPHDDQVDAFTHGMEHQRETGYNLDAIIGKK